MINNLQRAIVLNNLAIVENIKDPEDAFLISMATQGEADYLITGDHRAGLLEKNILNAPKL
jgi:uncharacterized protein